MWRQKPGQCGGQAPSDCTEPECLQDFHMEMSARGPERPLPKFGWEERAGEKCVSNTNVELKILVVRLSMEETAMS